LLEERILIRHCYLEHLFYVLGLYRGKIYEKLLIEHHKGFVSRELGQEIEDVIEVDWVSQ
jgi:hypothetical protein